MRFMRWSWDDLQEAPADVVLEVIAVMNEIDAERRREESRRAAQEAQRRTQRR